MSEEVKSKAQVLREELDNLKMALQTAAGDMDEQVQAIIARMKAVLAPAAYKPSAEDLAAAQAWIDQVGAQNAKGLSAVGPNAQ